MVTLPFQFMREKLMQAVNGENKKKMAFIVLHSSTLIPIMVQLNVTSPDCLAQQKNGTLSPHSNCESPLYGCSLII
jgi:hypothetical protein